MSDFILMPDLKDEKLRRSHLVSVIRYSVLIFNSISFHIGSIRHWKIEDDWIIFFFLQRNLYIYIYKYFFFVDTMKNGCWNQKYTFIIYLYSICRMCTVHIFHVFVCKVQVISQVSFAKIQYTAPGVGEFDK